MQNNQRKKLSLKPQNISRDLWFYEDEKGIAIIYQGKILKPLIPWFRLKRSVERRYGIKIKS